METVQLPSLGETIRQALRLNPQIYAAVQQNTAGIGLALAIVCLACLSESVGQSIILFINKVRPRRFVLALAIATLSRLSGYLLWTVVVWLISTFMFGHRAPPLAVASAVGLAYAPQLLAFFILTPFFGNIFSIFMSLWSMLAILVAVRIGVGLETWEAVVASGLGWLLIQIWQRTLGRPIYALGRWLERRAAGDPLQFKIHDLMQLRPRPHWIDKMPDWKQLHTQAEQVVRQISASQGDHTHG